MADETKEPSLKLLSKTNALLLPISTSRENLARVSNITTTWKKLCEDLSNPVIDSLTMPKFLKLPVAEQHKRKNQGYIVGGHFDNHRRKKTNLQTRSILTFDIDQCSKEFLDELLNPMWSVLADFEYKVYSTRSHTDEAPRVRVIVPLTKPIPKEQYTPLMRILAFQLDPDMETVDPVSFRPAQVMYLPSICKDAPFISFRNATGVVLDAAEHFKTWPTPWTDYQTLPVSPREGAARRALDKAPDPRTKSGIVGAWCRVYDMHTLIYTYLSDIYVPGDEDDRYSYADGHTRNGAVLYDEATYLYSHHGTDPCSGRLVNAWDCYRIHKFGHLDKMDDIEEAEGNVTKLPSHIAMLEFAGKDETVQRERANEYYDEEAIIADFETDDDEEEVASATEVASEVTIAKEEETENWKDELERYETGLYKPSFNNMRLILENDRRIKGCLAFNQFNMRRALRKQIRSKHVKLPKVRDTVNGDSLTDHVTLALRVILEMPPKKGGFGLKVTERDLNDAINAVSSRNQFHPIQDYLRNVKWDGKPRMRKLLSYYFGAKDSPLHEAFSFGFMVGAVQRVMEPGCKFDYVLILRGPQGIRKSGGLRSLAGPAFFGELTTPSLEDRAKVVEQLQGKWIVEIPELSQFRRSEVEVLKSLFSAQEDHIRLAWSRNSSSYLRQNVFSGTSNQDYFLKDDTGNRRFWPVVLTEEVDTTGIERDRNQLWAEAYQEYMLLRLDTDHPILPLDVPPELQAAAKRAQDNSSERPYEIMAATISAWLDTEVPSEQTELNWRSADEDVKYTGEMVKRDKTCPKDIADLCLGLRDYNNKANKDIPAAMRSLSNWKPGPRERVKGSRQQTYVRIKK